MRKKNLQAGVAYWPEHCSGRSYIATAPLYSTKEEAEERRRRKKKQQQQQQKLNKGEDRQTELIELHTRHTHYPQRIPFFLSFISLLLLLLSLSLSLSLFLSLWFLILFCFLSCSQNLRGFEPTHHHLLLLVDLFVSMTMHQTTKEKQPSLLDWEFFLFPCVFL